MDDAARRLRRLGMKDIPEGFDPDAGDRASGLLSRMGRAIRAGVGERDRWTDTLMRHRKAGLVVAGMPTLAGIAVAGTLVAGGPMLQGGGEKVDIRGDTEWSKAIETLETSYASRMRGGTTPIIVDVDALSQIVAQNRAANYREAGEKWLNARLNAIGNYAISANIHEGLIDDMTERLSQPTAAPGIYVGYSFAEGPTGFGIQDVSLITTHHRGALDMGGAAGMPTEQSITTQPFSNAQADALWQKFTTIHELEHAVDQDRQGGFLARALADDEGAPSHSVTRYPDLKHLTDEKFQGEVYADLKTAMTSIIDTGDTGIAQLISDTRALTVADSVADGRMPNGLSHFTSSALDRMIQDVQSGDLDLTGFSKTEQRTLAEDDRLDALARDYQAAAYADYQQIDLDATWKAVQGGPAPLAGAADRLEEAGWPTDMVSAVRRSVDSYQAHLDCEPLTDTMSHTTCIVVDVNGHQSRQSVPERIAGTERDLDHLQSSFDRDYDWNVHPAAAGTADLAPVQQEPAVRAEAADPRPGADAAEPAPTLNPFKRISDTLRNATRSRAAPQSEVATSPDVSRFHVTIDPRPVPAAETPEAAFVATAGAARMLEEATPELPRADLQSLKGLQQAAHPERIEQFKSAPPEARAASLRRAAATITRVGEAGSHERALGAIVDASARNARQQAEQVARALPTPKRRHSVDVER